jgi:hypothetical protein
MVLTCKKKKRIHFLGHLQLICVICGEKIVYPKFKQMTCGDVVCDTAYKKFQTWEYRKNYKLKSGSNSGRRNGI